MEGERGFAEPCEVDEAGLLLARLGPRTASTASALRDVFERDDAWMSSESLCVRDEDGDHWLLGSVDALIHTDTHVVAPLPIVRALESMPAVDLAVAYGQPAGDGAAEVAVCAVSLRPGATLSASDVSGALARLNPDDRPTIVRVVDEIALTAWYRPIAGPLRDEDIRPATKKHPAWYRAPGGRYRALTDATLNRVLAIAG